MYKTYFSVIIFCFCVVNSAYATWFGKSEIYKKEIYPLYNYVVLYMKADSGNFTCAVRLSRDVFHLGDKFEKVNVSDYTGMCIQLDKLEADNVIYKYLGLLAGLLAGFAIVRWWTSLM